MAFPAEILTIRLRLRPPCVADAEQVCARYGHDPVVSRYMSWQPHRSFDDTRCYLERIAGDNEAGRSCGFLIFLRDAGELLGSVGGAIDRHRMKFGYCLAQDAWGKGFATEAARAFVAAAIAHPPIIRVQAYCDVANRTSARVLEKAGLTCEGTLRRYMVFPNLGEAPRDVHFYSIVRNEETCPSTNLMPEPG
jgi:RimJ/RimL family protein N-acetyltransferase